MTLDSELNVRFGPANCPQLVGRAEKSVCRSFVAQLRIAALDYSIKKAGNDP